MSAEIPTQPPNAIVAGDTAKWFHELAEYSAADGYALQYRFEGPSQFTIAAAQDGSSSRFAVSVPYATTGTYAPGEYRWIARVEKAGERFTADRGTMHVLPNFAEGAVSAAFTAWQEALASYRALASKKVRQGTINGKTFEAQDLEEMRKAVDRLEADYRRELAAIDLAAGRGGRRRLIVTKFTSPR